MDNINYHEKYERRKLSVGLACLGLSGLSLTATAATGASPEAIAITIPIATIAGIIGGPLAISAATELYEGNTPDKKYTESKRTINEEQQNIRMKPINLLVK